MHKGSYTPHNAMKYSNTTYFLPILESEHYINSLSNKLFNFNNCNDSFTFVNVQ